MKTLIFGAGASIPFFNPILNTQYLTDRVMDINEWKRVLDKYKENNGKNHLIVNENVIVQVINDIVISFSQANFENIAEIIDKISSYGCDSSPSHNMMNLLFHIYLRKLNIKYYKPFGREWGDVPFLYREIIAEAILDLQKNHKRTDYDILSAKQKQFIQTICQKDEDVNIMSLNYDNCINDSISDLGFELGFSDFKEHYLSQLDIKKFMDLTKVVYYPHGHINFQFTDNENVTYWQDSEVADQERWIGVEGRSIGSTQTTLSGPFASDFNTFIFTGKTKDEGLNHLPYAVYYQRFAADLLKSDTIYIIGYSFGDAHFNRLLHSFLKLSNDNKIIVVDYYPKKITLVDEYKDKDNDNIILKIYQNLYAEWQILVDNKGIKSPLHKNEIDNLNKLGYGRLFPQIYFYKKGYEEFLNEYNHFIDLDKI